MQFATTTQQLKRYIRGGSTHDMRALGIVQLGTNAAILQQHIDHVLMLLGGKAKEANLLSLKGLQAMRLCEVVLCGLELQRITC